jgi:hypothetical protein
MDLEPAVPRATTGSTPHADPLAIAADAPSLTRMSA